MKPETTKTRSEDFSHLFNLNSHAVQVARGRGAILGILLVLILSAAIGFLVWLESFRYFHPQVKSALSLALILIVVLIPIGVTLYYWLLKKQILPDTKPEILAKEIGNQIPTVGDRLLNAVQLSKNLPEIGVSNELHQAAVDAGSAIIKQVPSGLLFPRTMIRRRLKRILYLFGALVLLYLINFNTSNQAIARLGQPEKQFEYPLPLQLSLSADENRILAGDSLTLSGRIQGRQSESVELRIESRRDTAVYALPVVDGHFELRQNHLLHSFTATAQVKNTRPWEPWDMVESPPLIIQVINRPIVQNLSLQIRPPHYTRLPTEVLTRDILSISGYEGSRIRLKGLASKEIVSASLKFKSGKSIPFDLQGQTFSVDFPLQVADVVWLELQDDEGVSNLDPLEYPIHIIPDIPPAVRILVPGQDVVLGENMLLPLRMKLDDDFGFSRLQLNYQIKHPDYLMADTSVYVQTIDLPPENLSSMDINYMWDLNQLSIMPEDALEYWVTVWDNNTVSGPRMATSRKWLARLPSLDEMFEEMDAGKEEVKKEQEEVLDIVNEIKEKVDELALEVQKDPNLNWEQQQEATAAMEQMEELEKQLQNISDQLDEMMQSAEEQNLFSEETLDKYSELQELMEQLITPELKEAMERLQEAMEQNDTREMEMALEDFQMAMEDFQESVERTLEIFKQIEVEQKMDELAKRLNDLADRQEELSENLDSQNPSEAAEQEQKIAQDFDKAQETAEDLEQLMEQNTDLSTQEVQDLQAQMNQEQIAENLESAASNMQQGMMQEAQPPANQAAQSLREMASQSGQMQMSMQQQMMDQVVSEFRSAMMKTLRLSQAQEALETPTSKTSNQSSLLRDYADQQMALMQGLSQLSSDLQELGTKTFAISPAQGKSLGSAQAHMQASIEGLEARNARKSARSQASARESLNQLARQLNNAMQQLQQSGQASGFDQYMEQLQQMAGQQQGLNQQTMMQLGMGNPSMMQQLARQQLQLREALQQIESGMGNDSRMLGDLGKIGEEMEAVARELTSRRPSQRIHERQEKILNRLLDAQRSATQRDFSKKRKSETAKDLLSWNGSGRLPDNLGETRNQLYEELIYSLKQNYTQEEEALIREYFNQLEAALNE